MNENLISNLYTLDSILDVEVHSIVEYNLYSKLKNIISEIIDIEEKKEQMFDYYIDEEKKYFKGFLTNEQECDKKNPFYNTLKILLKDFSYLGKFYNNQLSSPVFDIYKNISKEIITFKKLSEKLEKSKQIYKFTIKDENVTNYFLNSENKNKLDYPNYEIIINARRVEHVIEYLKNYTGFDVDFKNIAIKHNQVYTGHEIAFNYSEKEKKEKKFNTPDLF